MSKGLVPEEALVVLSNRSWAVLVATLSNLAKLGHAAVAERNALKKGRVG